MLSRVVNGFKWAAQQSSTLRAARALLRGFAKQRTVVGADQQQLLAQCAAISPQLREEVSAEFAAISQLLDTMNDGAAAAGRWQAAHPLAELFTQAAELNVVYTPGKVGSRSVAATLQGHAACRLPVLRAHFLSSSGLAFNESLALRCAGRPAAADGWRDQALRGRWLRVLVAINRAMRARKPFVIAGVREPMAMHLSFCFEASWMYADTPAFLDADFVRKRLADDAWHRHCNDWFARDLHEMFGVDVFAQRFPVEQGWDVYENDSVRVLLIRQESLSRLPDALSAFYGFDASTFRVANENTAEAKPYAGQYAEVRNALKLADSELNDVYALPYVRHFYSPAEIEAFKQRWHEYGACSRNCRA